MDRVRPLNLMLRESFAEQISTMKKEEVIEETSSVWAAAMVLITKTNGSVLWAVDYRPLNRVTVVDWYPLPYIEEIIEKLARSNILLTLDAASAYHKIPVEKKSRHYLAFVCAFRSYSFKKSATNTEATNSCFVNVMVEKLRSPYILTHLDNGLVATPTLEKQLKELERTLAVHLECGIRLKARKTFLFRNEENYLEYEVNGKCFRLHWEDITLANACKWKEINNFIRIHVLQ